MKRIPTAAFLLVALSLPAAEVASRNLGSIGSGTTIPQIAIGDDTWSTEFQILNLERDAEPFTLSFFNPNGNRMALDLFSASDEFLGTVSSFSGVVPQVGAVFLHTRNTGPLREGYAVLENTDPRKVAVTAVITNAFAGQTNFRASVPGLRTFNHQLRTPFTNTEGFNTCMAVKSDGESAQMIAYIARDSNGGELCRAHDSLQGRQHDAFCLPERLPCVAGRQGVVEVIAPVGITGVAFTFDPGGRFWTQIPYDVDLF